MIKRRYETMGNSGKLKPINSGNKPEHQDRLNHQNGQVQCSKPEICTRCNKQITVQATYLPNVQFTNNKDKHVRYKKHWEDHPWK